MSAEAPAREPRTDRGRRTREGLVAAARGVFERQGFAATRMGDIAAEAGVSHGTVYTYFETKEDVLAATIETVIAELMASIRSVDLADPVERIARANSGYLATVAHNAKLLRVVEEVAVTDERFARILADLRRTHVHRVTAQIERLQADGDAGADLDPQIAAAALCAMVEGFSRHWTQLGSRDDPGGRVTLTLLWQRALGLRSQREHDVVRTGPSTPRSARGTAGSGTGSSSSGFGSSSSGTGSTGSGTGASSSGNDGGTNLEERHGIHV